VLGQRPPKAIGLSVTIELHTNDTFRIAVEPAKESDSLLREAT
jgi:hypothetical protein